MERTTLFIENHTWLSNNFFDFTPHKSHVVFEYSPKKKNKPYKQNNFSFSSCYQADVTLALDLR